MSKSSGGKDQAPLLIEGTSVSQAYAKVLLQIVEQSGTEISPLILSVTGFNHGYDIPEDAQLRFELDKLLGVQGKLCVEDVAYTIFPQRLWTMAQGDRQKLFQYYKMAIPFYRKRDARNRRGLYFQRLVDYGRGPCDGNQLEWILQQCNARDGVRRSMAQATTFDPEHDHDATAQLPFPCLQHVSFVPTAAGLVTNAFYATQQLFDKGYGNYLGLAQLAAFMAQEMKMPLARLNVTIGVAKLERIGKTNAGLQPVLSAAKACVGLDDLAEAKSAIPLPETV